MDSLFSTPYEGPKVHDGLSVASLLTVEDSVVWPGKKIIVCWSNVCLRDGEVFLNCQLADI